MGSPVEAIMQQVFTEPECSWWLSRHEPYCLAHGHALSLPIPALSDLERLYILRATLALAEDDVDECLWRTIHGVPVCLKFGHGAHDALTPRETGARTPMQSFAAIHRTAGAIATGYEAPREGSTLHVDASFGAIGSFRGDWTKTTVAGDPFWKSDAGQYRSSGEMANALGVQGLDAIKPPGKDVVLLNPHLGDALIHDKPAGGTQGAQWYHDASGQKYVVKGFEYEDKNRVSAEALAGAVYTRLGVPVPETTLTTLRGQPVYASKAIDGRLKATITADSNLAKGFMADVFTANRDVIGLDFDNIVYPKDGSPPVRVDLGGTFQFRAQGGAKPFNTAPTEHHGLLNGEINPQSAQAFGKIPVKTLRAQAKVIATKMTDTWMARAVASAQFPDPHVASATLTGMTTRRDWMVKFAKGDIHMAEWIIPWDQRVLADDAEIDDCHWVTIRGNAICIGGSGHGGHYKGAKKPTKNADSQIAPEFTPPTSGDFEEQPNPQISDMPHPVSAMTKVIKDFLGLAIRGVSRPTHATESLWEQRMLSGDWDESKHPRDPGGPDGGQFVSAGGGEEAIAAGGPGGGDTGEVGGKGALPASSTEAVVASPLSLRGWNPPDLYDQKRQDSLDAHATEAVATFDKAISEESGAALVAPGVRRWDDLSPTLQTKIENQWVEDHTEEFYDSEVESWRENLPEEIDQELRDDKKWSDDTLTTLLTDAGADPKTIGSALVSLEQSGPDAVQTWEGKGLTFPEDAQVTLPGVVAGSHWESIRAAITAQFKEEWDTEKDSRIEQAEEPDYLRDQANESATEMFGQLDDTDKFEWAQENMKDSLDAADVGDSPVDLPNNWKISIASETLKGVSDIAKAYTRDYEATGAVGRAVVIHRTVELAAERVVGGAIDAVTEEGVKELSETIWSNWKSSSSSRIGMALQLAASEELGAHWRDPSPDVKEGLQVGALSGAANPEEFKADIKAWSEVKNLPGGFDGLKAYTRALWETTQGIMAKADIPDVTIYRAYMIAGTDMDKEATVEVSSPEEIKGMLLPNLQHQQNGAMSFTLDPRVANGWDGIGNALPKSPQRVVIKAVVPATALLSIPAYGENLQEEQEFVVLGTPWKHWEAWQRRAPAGPVLTREGYVEAAAQAQVTAEAQAAAYRVGDIYKAKSGFMGELGLLNNPGQNVIVTFVDTEKNEVELQPINDKGEVEHSPYTIGGQEIDEHKYKGLLASMGKKKGIGEPYEKGDIFPLPNQNGEYAKIIAHTTSNIGDPLLHVKIFSKDHHVISTKIMRPDEIDTSLVKGWWGEKTTVPSPSHVIPSSMLVTGAKVESSHFIDQEGEIVEVPFTGGSGGQQNVKVKYMDGATPVYKMIPPASIKKINGQSV